MHADTIGPGLPLVNQVTELFWTLFGKIMLFEEFAAGLDLPLGQLDTTAWLHGHCHQKAEAVMGPVEAPGAGVQAIRDAFAGYATASDGWAQGKGCLLCNTAAERGALEQGARTRVAAYLERLTAAFARALRNAQADGDVRSDADVDELAAYFTTALIGVAACIRAEAPPAQVKAACVVATSVLDTYAPQPVR